VTRPLVILNPNSSDNVTQGIADAVEPLTRLDIPIRCETLAEGPPAIESDADIASVDAPLRARAAKLERTASALVIACFSDPAVPALRTALDIPVLGIAEAAYATALTQGARFGVISILLASIPRHARAIADHGLTDRCAGDRAMGLGVAALADRTATKAALLRTGNALILQDGAEVLILGCAGLAAYRPWLQAQTGHPVIDPCQAAAALALSRIVLEET
jgi:Asp/Glu/hydantoin racemase